MPAVGSGRSILMYGPPGNGKTSVALRLRHVFADTVYVPHGVMIDGRVMRVFDPATVAPVKEARRMDRYVQFANAAAKTCCAIQAKYQSLTLRPTLRRHAINCSAGFPRKVL